MDSLLKSDKYTSTRNNPYTGQTMRQWVQYNDGMFEPVRKDGNLNRKYHADRRTFDWWAVEKPMDWTPADEGKQVTLNHDYRRPGAKPGGTKENKPFGEQKKPVTKPLGLGGLGSANSAIRTRKFRKEDEGKIKHVLKKTTLLLGAKAYHEFEKERMAGKENRQPPQEKTKGKLRSPEEKTLKSSAQAAAGINRWEREQGIDPNQRSGHERRPPSSSKDAAEMKHLKRGLEKREYPQWLTEARRRGQANDPLKGWLQLNENLAVEGAQQALKEGLSGAKRPLMKTLGKSIPGIGLIWDYIISPDEVSD